jgi:hypothetical protein
MPKMGQIITKLWDERGPDECWPWLGSTNKQTGYGKKRFHNRDYQAHRWMYEQKVGKIPEGLTIDHLCKNRSCVNPAHLEPVTQAENVRRGAGTKLAKEQASEIKERFDKRKRGDRKMLAAMYGVSPQLISDIWYGRAWR